MRNDLKANRLKHKKQTTLSYVANAAKAIGKLTCHTPATSDVRHSEVRGLASDTTFYHPTA